MKSKRLSEVINSKVVKAQLEERGLSVEDVEEQLRRFEKGFPDIELERPCTLGDGILYLDEDSKKSLVQRYNKSLDFVDTVKFVPASGAATRMFRDLISDYDLLRSGRERNPRVLWASKKFVDNIERFAFYDDLVSTLASRGLNIEELIKRSDFFPILDALFSKGGMNYANLPKGLIKFHRYGSEARTAFEEHLPESKSYLIRGSGTVYIHFTVPERFKKQIEDMLNRVVEKYVDEDVDFDISYSVQDPSTDTIAVDMNNFVVVDDQGRLVFRPGGHGALLQNLNSLDADIIFIKNIDNVLVERYIPLVSFHKMVLGGLLINIRDRVHGFLREMEEGNQTEEDIQSMCEFCKKVLFIDFTKCIEGMDVEQAALYMKEKLNRPIRVCGVVKNEGEPGGGPFWVRERDGSLSLQIVESAQVNMDSERQRSIWESSTHFNPVDLACCVRDYTEKKFDLKEFVDSEAGIITRKSLGGMEIKALELPGLWNGSMSGWITVFTEVPLETFSPVKTVFDLLREQHQGS